VSCKTSSSPSQAQNGWIRKNGVQMHHDGEIRARTRMHKDGANMCTHAPHQAMSRMMDTSMDRSDRTLHHAVPCLRDKRNPTASLLGVMCFASSPFVPLVNLIDVSLMNHSFLLLTMIKSTKPFYPFKKIQHHENIRPRNDVIEIMVISSSQGRSQRGGFQAKRVVVSSSDDSDPENRISDSDNSES
jgi:hypothetical protein